MPNKLRLFTRCGLLWILALSLASSATATSFSIVGGGLDVGFACESSAASGACASSADFSLNGIGTTTGSIVDSAGTLSITLSMASASMTGAFNSVTELVFSSVSISMPSISTLTIGNQILGLGFAAGTISGTYAQIGGAGPQLFSDGVSFSNVSCLITSGSGQCGFSVTSRDFQLDVDGTSHDLSWTFNVTVPEPGTAALLGLGLVGLALRRRRS